MRDFSQLDLKRVLIGTVSDDGGWFEVASPIDRGLLRVVASFGMGWDHVSISRKNRVPNWAEMEHVKRLFFKDDETAVQYHVPSTDHVNMHEYTLHLWRPQDVDLPRPPSFMVGVGDHVARDEDDARAMAREAGYDGY